MFQVICYAIVCHELTVDKFNILRYINFIDAKISKDINPWANLRVLADEIVAPAWHTK